MQNIDEVNKGASFLIRIWKDTPEGEWRGQVEHIQTGRKAHFTGWEAITEICHSLFTGE